MVHEDFSTLQLHPFTRTTNKHNVAGVSVRQHVRKKKKRQVAGFGLNIGASDGIVMKAGVKLLMLICPILNESSRIKHSPDVNHLWMTLVKTQLHNSSPGGLSREAGHILIEIYFQYNCKRVWYRATLFHDNALFARSRTNRKCAGVEKTFSRTPLKLNYHHQV